MAVLEGNGSSPNALLSSDPALLGGTASDESVSTTQGITSTIQSDSGDLVVGTSGNDHLLARVEKLTIIGNGGTDIYIFGAKNTSEIILNGLSSDPAASGTLQFSEGLTDRTLWFDRVDGTGAVSATGDDLRIDVLGTTRAIMIDNWFAPGDTYAQLSQIVLKDGMRDCPNFCVRGEVQSQPRSGALL